MKNSIDLPDELFIAAKKRAGGLPPGVDVSDRAAMHESLRQQQ